MTGFYDAIAVPFGWLLGQFYNLFNNYFVAIAFFALLVKLALLPSAISQQKSSAKQIRLQPKLRRIQDRYKGDKDAQRKVQEEQQALYQREGFNPMNQGCLPLLIQFPIIIGLYGAVYKPLAYCLKISDTVIAKLTELVVATDPDKIRAAATAQGISGAILDKIAEFGSREFAFFGLSLGQNPSFKVMNLLLLIPVFSFITSMASSLVSFIRSKKSNPSAANNATMGCMTFGMPLFSLYFVTMFPAAIGIYWIINNIYTFIQTFLVGKIFSPEKTIAKTMVEETIYRRSKEANTKLIAAKKTQE